MRWRALGAAVLIVLATAGTSAGRAREAVAAPPPGYPISGIDVSHWQGTINWSQVAASGRKFAYAKVSEGMDYADPRYAANRTAARAAGIKFGGYHYARPEEGNPRGQADRLIDLGGYPTGRQEPAQIDSMLPPMLDIEWPWEGGALDPCYKLTPNAMVAWISEFVDQVRRRTGQPTMIYTNVNWWNPCTANSTAFGSQPLFVARYNTSPGTMPAGWTSWTIWQYTNNENVSGVAGGVDGDVFNGDAAAFSGLTRRELSPPSSVRSPVPGGADPCSGYRTTRCPTPSPATGG
ncbi:glycoside hydrolase family 25 protein [Plantactinospora sp. GCM10030261]|uniref:glycoside hydrolase family 25 protein n=1 Tax=Plantactinospora sp. GCM10030261 TaxID=3273420 RepID=UPI00361B4CAF